MADVDGLGLTAVLDVYRVLVSFPSVAQAQVLDDTSIIHDCLKLVSKWKGMPPGVQTQLLRSFCNISADEIGAQFLIHHADLFDVIAVSITSENEALRDGGATLAANLSMHEVSDNYLQVISALATQINKEKRVGIAQKMLLALYRIINASATCKEVARVLDVPLNDAERREGCGALVHAVRSSLYT
jgi:hypothetical protein